MAPPSSGRFRESTACSGRGAGWTSSNWCAASDPTADRRCATTCRRPRPSGGASAGGCGPRAPAPRPPPRSSVAGASAYLKIADGCRRPCAFCAIPLIKGTAVSRPLETLVDEVRQLEGQGVREVILIAQDTTDYGHDLGLKDGLPTLLTAMLQAAPRIDWFRLLYAYPGAVTERLIDLMASEPRLIPYLDMPLQHAHPAVLRRMRRPANMTAVIRTLERMRQAMPRMALRTTFIVGYPGETEAEFDELMAFVEAMRFDRMGVFTFSFEPGTTSEPLGDPVPAEVKEERRRRLMERQQQISLEVNQSHVGRVLPVLIEGSDGGLSLGRSYRDAPEIDGMVIVEGEIPVGEMVPVRISGAMAYDLTGVVEREAAKIILETSSYRAREGGRRTY